MARAKRPGGKNAAQQRKQKATTLRAMRELPFPDGELAKGSCTLGDATVMLDLNEPSGEDGATWFEREAAFKPLAEYGVDEQTRNTRVATYARMAATRRALFAHAVEVAKCEDRRLRSANRAWVRIGIRIDREYHRSTSRLACRRARGAHAARSCRRADRSGSTPRRCRRRARCAR